MQPIDVWLFQLDCSAEARAGLEPWLSDSERDRRQRLVRQTDRDRFTVTRGTVRQILGNTIGQAPESLAFTHNVHGKPALAGIAQPHFNLSHSAGLGVLGVSRSVPFGIDIEKIEPVAASVAEISFSHAEQAELAAGHPLEWLESFYRGWTRKEAVIKALGLGLAQPLDAFDVSLGPRRPARLLRLAGAQNAPLLWQLFHFVPAPGYMGAVAIPEPGHSIVLRRWAPPA